MNEIVKLRKTENMHIVFWLVKDTCWVTDFKIPGLIMILPTISVAIWMCFRTAHLKAELAHNMAVAFWITANSIWMIGEFYYGDGTRPLAIIFFAAGLGTLAYYYISTGLMHARRKSIARREK